MSVPVVNTAAPEVWFTAPADGARLPAGVRATVRVEASRADAVRVLVDGTPAWTAPGPSLERPWTPSAGSHRLVAVASRDGAPDAIASIAVVAVADAPVPAAPAPAPPAPAPPAGRATPAAPVPAPIPGPGRGGAVEDPAPSVPAAATTPRPRPGGDAPPSSGAPAAPAPSAPRARAGGDHRGGPVAAIGRLLRDPERVAWTVAFPVLLMLAALAYALLQRFIDGGQKLAWRGRGDPDDTMIEF